MVPDTLVESILVGVNCREGAVRGSEELVVEGLSLVDLVVENGPHAFEVVDEISQEGLDHPDQAGDLLHFLLSAPRWKGLHSHHSSDLLTSWLDETDKRIGRRHAD